MGDAVTVEYGDGVIEISINRPEARNALNGAVLPRLIPPTVAMELALTGDFFSAADALRYGLVNSLTPPGEALAGARALAARITANGPLAVAATKEIITRAADWTLEGWDAQQPILAPVFASADAREGARAFAEKRAPRWTGR